MRGRRAVRDHPFFVAHVDVDALEERKLVPPWTPTIRSDTDIRNFDDYSDIKDADEDGSRWERYLTTQPDDPFAAWQSSSGI